MATTQLNSPHRDQFPTAFYHLNTNDMKDFHTEDDDQLCSSVLRAKKDEEELCFNYS